MKKTYFNPEAMILVIADEDILTASGGVLQLYTGDTPNGYEDHKSINDLFV